jgi:hypothetical protein
MGAHAVTGDHPDPIPLGARHVQHDRPALAGAAAGGREHHERRPQDVEVQPEEQLRGAQEPAREAGGGPRRVG